MNKKWAQNMKFAKGAMKDGYGTAIVPSYL